MALTKRIRKEKPTVEHISSTSRNIEETEELNIIDFSKTKNIDSKKRKTIKVDPEIKSLIEIFSDFGGTKEYETLRNMAEFYYKKIMMKEPKEL